MRICPPKPNSEKLPYNKCYSVCRSRQQVHCVCVVWHNICIGFNRLLLCCSFTELSIMPSRIRSIKYQDWTSVEATDALSFFLATFGKKEILRCIEARMSWSFFCAATHNLFIKLLARPDCTVDKAIELLASNFGSNAHKAGGIAILASLLARPDCTFDKAIQLLASPFKLAKIAVPPALCAFDPTYAGLRRSK